MDKEAVFWTAIGSISTALGIVATVTIFAISKFWNRARKRKDYFTKKLLEFTNELSEFYANGHELNLKNNIVGGFSKLSSKGEIKKNIEDIEVALLKNYNDKLTRIRKLGNEFKINLLSSDAIKGLRIVNKSEPQVTKFIFFSFDFNKKRNLIIKSNLNKISSSISKLLKTEKEARKIMTKELETANLLDITLIITKEIDLINKYLNTIIANTKKVQFVNKKNAEPK